MKVEDARKQDKFEFDRKISEFKKAFGEWKQDKDFADRILIGDTSAFDEALKEATPFSDFQDLIDQIKIVYPANQSARVRINVKSEDVVPSQIKSLLQSGKLSSKAMPKAKFYELYQNYVCSLVLRVTEEMFALLPLESIAIEAVDDLLNPSTGLIEQQVILSVAIPRATVERINIPSASPTDCLKFFNHQMDFSKTTGFRPLKNNAS